MTFGRESTSNRKRLDVREHTSGKKARFELCTQQILTWLFILFAKGIKNTCVSKGIFQKCIQTCTKVIGFACFQGFLELKFIHVDSDVKEGHVYATNLLEKRQAS